MRARPRGTASARGAGGTTTGRRPRVIPVLAAGLCLTGCSAAAAPGPTVTTTAAVTATTVGPTPTSAGRPAAPPSAESVPVTVTTPAATPPGEPPLAGRTVVLDPGHNGGNAAHPEIIDAPVPAGGFDKPCNTTGTETDDGYAEHAYTWDVATRAAALLRSAGAVVVLTRENDTGVGPCVDRRAAIANDAAADAVVSIHADGAADGVRGFHVIEPARAPDGGNAAVLDSSAELGGALLEAFAAGTGEPRATYPGALVAPGLTRRDDLAGLNLARVPTVFIESGNMRNPADAAELTDPLWRQQAAAAIVAGLTTYLT